MLFSMLVAAGLLVAGISLYAKTLAGGVSTFAEVFPVIAMGVATLVLLAVSLLEIGFYRYRVITLSRREKALRAAVDALDADDDERAGRESALLHDDVGGGLTALRLAMERLRDHPAAIAEWNAAFADLDGLLGRVRGAARALHPGFSAGLDIFDVLRETCGNLAERGGKAAEFDFEGDSDALGHAEATCVLKVVREAVVNSIRHSGCSCVRIAVAAGGVEVRGGVEDDGRGFAKSREGLGLTLMRERVERLGGALSLGRSRLGGARVAFRFPLGGPAA